MDIGPVTLTGRHVRLEPLSLEHLSQLWEVAREVELGEWPAVKTLLEERLARG